MRTVLARRFLFALVALLAVLFLSAFGLSMARGAPFHKAVQEAARRSTGYLWAVAHGDLGVSTSRQREPLAAGPVIATTLGRSLMLLGTALAIGGGLGVLLGGSAARRRRSPWATPILFSSLVGISMPSFFLALLLQTAAIRFNQATGVRLVSLGGIKGSSLWLPALVLAARPFAQTARVTFIAISQALEEDYVRTALGKGVPWRLLFQRHVYRNAAIPILTSLVASIRFALVSLPVVEYFFAWPGAGEALLRAIRRQDDALVYGLLLALGLLFILANSGVEVLYRWLDPRLAAAGSTRVSAPFHLGIGAAAQELALWLVDSAPVSAFLRLLRRQPRPQPSAFAEKVHTLALAQSVGSPETLHHKERRRAWLHGTLLNPTLLLGLTLLFPLLGLVIAGSYLAPHNPYNTVTLRFVDGHIQTPPFLPGHEFPLGTDPLGRDIWSLILVGAQQTLLVASVVVLARIGIGVALGLGSGWFEGSWFDHAVVGLIDIIAAFPTLLCAMVLILALGIRQGISSFVVALCFVGWGEVAQFVRTEVVRLKSRPFIEAALITGNRWPDLLSHHILPNLLSPIIALAALEVAAVLMLLGELGFVGIFIGGGAFAELVVFGPAYYYSDVPEWAALLANVRSFARSYPWMAWPPAIAFALTILAFNLTGEGILRLIERVGASFTRLVNRYTAAGAAVVVAVVLVVRAHVGPLAFYRPLATAFDGERALAHVRALTSPEMVARRPGSPEAERAAEYIAAQFAAAGLQPAGQRGTYFQETVREYLEFTAPPALGLIQPGGQLESPWTWGKDYAVAPDTYPQRWMASGEVVFVALGPFPSSSTGTYPTLRKLPLADKVVLVPDRKTFDLLARQSQMAAALILDEQPGSVERFDLGIKLPTGRHWAGPAFIVRPQVAEALVAGSGTTLEALRARASELQKEEVFLQPLGKKVFVQIPWEERRVMARNVLGLLPGGVGTGGAAGEGGGSTLQMDDQLVVLMAPYDAPGMGPDGTLYPAAQDSAAAVATLTELARSWQEADYRPKRSILFVAYVSQGVDPNHSYRRIPEAKDFLSAKPGFSSFKIWAVVQLGSLGDAHGDALQVDTGSPLLGNLLTNAGRRLRVPVERLETPVNLMVVQEGMPFTPAGNPAEEEAPRVRVSWSGKEWVSGSNQDTVERLSARALASAGRVISLALMVLGREWNY